MRYDLRDAVFAGGGDLQKLLAPDAQFERRRLGTVGVFGLGCSKRGDIRTGSVSAG